MEGVLDMFAHYHYDNLATFEGKLTYNLCFKLIRGVQLTADSNAMALNFSEILRLPGPFT